MTLLSKEQILSARSLPTEDVDVPEWGGTVRVRAMTGAERDEWEASLVQVNGSGARQMRLDNVRARLVALTVVGEDGERLFTSKDVAELGKQSASALDRVFDVSRRLSRLSEQDVEELTEGFGDGPSEASTSDSPGT